MAPEQKIGARPPVGAGAEAQAKSGKRRKKRLVSMMVGIALVAGLGAGYWFMMGPGAAATEAEATASAEPSYVLGEVLVIDSISINLEGGHYLRLGLGLQLVEGAGGTEGEVDPAKALDAAIALYSGLTQDELSDAAVREQLKTELTEVLMEAYENEVVGVYYTDFVTQ